VGLVVVCLALGVACGAGVDLGGSSGPCVVCTADQQCGTGSACARFGGGAYCAVLCPNDNECSDASTCTALSTISVDETTACVPRAASCASAPPDAGRESGSCAGLVGPSVSAPCYACDPKSKTCQPNGCYDGWFCEVAERDCQPPPAGCDAGTADARQD
jgi:hypothetical protein